MGVLRLAETLRPLSASRHARDLRIPGENNGLVYYFTLNKAPKLYKTRHSLLVR